MKKVWKVLAIMAAILLLLVLFAFTKGLVNAAVGLILVAGVYFWRRKRIRLRNDQLSGGFDAYRDVGLGDSEILRVVVQEELNHQESRRRYLQQKNTRLRKTILTTVYILVNVLCLSFFYTRSTITHWMTGLAMVYVFVLASCDPVSEVCAEVKRQPDREISQVVADMTGERKPRKLVVAGVVAFALSLVVFFAFNAQEQYRYEPVDGGYCLSSYAPGIPAKREVVIPETYQGQPVVAIGKRVFEGKAFIEEIQIPETVESIDSYAFKGCTGLERVELPAGLKVLNGESFKGCKNLRSIEIPAGVTEIRGNTFENCSKLESVVLHDGIIDIHAYAFSGCSRLKSITLPKSITEIHTYCFAECDSLQVIYIPEGVTRIAARAFYSCDSLRKVTVPETVREIGSSAFRECGSLKTITLPATVVVNDRAFKDTDVEIFYQ